MRRWKAGQNQRPGTKTGGKMTISKILPAALAAAGFVAWGAASATAADFYKGKTVSIYVGSGAGGGFDTYARAVGRHLSKHIPGNPAIKVQNRPGAGGRGNANLVYVSDPQDGTVIGALGPWLALEPLWGQPGVKFDPPKFKWLISLGREVSTCVFFNKSGATDIKALMKKKKIVMGASGPTSSMASDAFIMKDVLKLPIQVIVGFKGSRRAFMAAEKGELDGNCGLWYSSLQAQYMGPVKEGKANVTLQMGRHPHPKLKDVPFLYDIAKPKELARKAMDLVFTQMDLARPYVMGPKVPDAQVKTMRKAFMDLAKDPEFLATAAKLKINIDVVTGEEIQDLLQKAYNSPKDVVARARKMINR
jgi:tripartite-type tricarboxylate transporter receptor subunit TctC